MPTQSRGFFTCNFCGLVCDTLEEATDHEFQCSKRPQQAHRPSPPGASLPTSAQHSGYPAPHYGGGMAPLSTPQVDGYGPSPPHAPHGLQHSQYPQKLRSIALMGPSARETGVALEDCFACQSIELFEATPELAADYDGSRSGGTPVVVRQVGIRCIHCAKSPIPTANYSLVFPSSLGAMASNVRMIADSHLVTCRMTPPEIREACDRASKRRQEAGEGRGANDEDERNRMALLDYCVGFCQHMGIVNKQPHKTGISFADADPHGSNPPTPAETPAAHRGPALGAPYSGDRMGPPVSYDRRLGFPTPGGSAPRHGMAPMMGGPMGPTDGIAPTPLQRRRDRPGEPGDRAIYSAEREGGPPSAGFPTPYSQGPPGEGGYPHELQTPAQPNFEGKEAAYPTPHSAPPSAHPQDTSPGYNQYDLPSNFPFYQEADRSWHCKFCSHLHPSYRDPQAIWSTASGGPPPGNFIDSHLMLCRSYHQSMPSPPMYQGPPPPYGGPPPFAPGYPPPGWDGSSPTHVGGMPPQHMHYPPAGSHPGEPPFPYPPHMDPGRPYPGPEDPAYADQRARLGAPGHLPPGMVAHGGPPPPLTGLGGRTAAQRKENMADAVRHSINHLVAREKEYFARDPTAAKADRLVLEEDKLLLTDYFFFLMKQLRLCRFSESDRKTRGGKREKIKLGYGGLQCIHCADVPNSRKFFWSNVDRLANSFAEIPGHVLKCRRCPQQTKDSLLQLKQFHPEQMARLPRGSQKVFFRRMWRRLHDEDSKAGAAAEAALADKANNENVAPTKSENAETPQKEGIEIKQEKTKSPEEAAAENEENQVVMQRSTTEAAKALADATKSSSLESPINRVLLAVPDDKEWLSDMDCFIRKQLEVFCANEADVATAQSDRKYPVHVGQVGIRCIHCSGMDGRGAKGTAVAFPFAISGIYESVREFQRLHLDSCENLPASTKEKLAAFKGSSSLSSVLRKYYVLAAKALGLQDTREGIRAGAKAEPLGSQAAFSFAEGKDSHLFKEMRGIAAPYTGESSAIDPAADTTISPAPSTLEKVEVKTDEEKAEQAPEEEEGKKRQDSPVEPEEPPVKKVKADSIEEAETETSKVGESNTSSTTSDDAKESTDATPVASTDREAD